MADPVFGNVDTNSTQIGYDGAPSAVPSVNMGEDWWRKFYMDQAGVSRTGVGFDPVNQNQARDQQTRVIQDLQRSANGDMNSLAQQQLSRGYDDARSQQSSLGSTMRGQSAGAAMRGVQQGQQGIQRGFAGDQQMLMLQEQQAAQALMAQLLAQQQGQDIGLAQGMAQGQLGSQGLDDAARQFYLGGAGGMDIAATDRQNQIARAQLGYNDDYNNLVSGYVNSGINAAATGAGTIAQFGQGSGNKPWNGG